MHALYNSTLDTQHSTLDPLAPTVDDLAWPMLFGSLPTVLAIQPTNAGNSDISTADTITLMQQHSLADASHPVIETAAQELRDSFLPASFHPSLSSAFNLSSPDSNDQERAIREVFEYMKGKVKFVTDEEQTARLFGIEEGVELLVKPSALLSMNEPQGDCDDHSMLVASLLTNLGIKNRFITVGANSSNPGRWSHVYVMAELENGREIPIDASHGKVVGWEVPNPNRKGMWLDRLDSRSDNRNQDREGKEGNLDMDINSALGEIDFGKIIETAVGTTSSILKAQFGQPQLAPGTYIRRDANGNEILTNQPYPAGGLNIGVGTSGLSGSGLLLGAVVLIVAVIALKK